MATVMLLKKPSLMASVASRRTLAMLTSVIQGIHHHNPNLAPLPAIEETIRGGTDSCGKVRGIPSHCGAGYTRNFHLRSAQLDSKASITSPDGFAVSDSSDDNKLKFDDGLEISKLDIDGDIISALAGRGITKLFPIQRAVLEPAMQGSDMIGRARTGTGKTLAFGIPIIDKILKYNAKHGCGKNPLALVLTPTRELARQVEKEFNLSATKLDSLCVYGGTPIGRQMSCLDRGVDVVVGTPGRIIDLMKRGALELSEVQFLVLDEADQMLNVGFEEDVEGILKNLPRARQSMMFSATMPNWILKITRKYLNDPVTIDLVGDSDQKLAEGISLFSVVTDYNSKAALIGPLVTEHAKGGKCIVFTQTKRDADRLAYMMGRSYRCEALHGDISQSQREMTLAGFREGRFNILVATDVAARGLDIPNVDLIIHYELPSTSEIFVHRSGRTGRAGKKGTAILIHTYEQERAVRMIERDVGSRFVELPPISVDFNQREVFGDTGVGGRFESFGNTKGGRSAGPSGSSSFGGFSGGYNDFASGRSGGHGGSTFGRSGGFSESGSGRFGSYPRSFGRSNGGFGDRGPSRPKEGYGRSGTHFGDLDSSDRSTGFDTYGSGRRSSFEDVESSRSRDRFGSAQSGRYQRR